MDAFSESDETDIKEVPSEVQCRTTVSIWNSVLNFESGRDECRDEEV